MIDGGLSDKTDGMLIDPLPEGHVLIVIVRLHLCLLFDIEDLQRLASCNRPIVY